MKKYDAITGLTKKGNFEIAVYETESDKEVIRFDFEDWIAELCSGNWVATDCHVLLSRNICIDRPRC